ncbi:hypothetical protein QR680_000594 [Steinernema hermaphroditum]|uniref:Uncharacterized protein n=1 Tax=Steinernema hermaphroditum TaxID=289476 RepID=A0AA39GVW5_9BILA|nr:hypothetical protein QR680_000594 [Steinernema hermaphroditum]
MKFLSAAIIVTFALFILSVQSTDTISDRLPPASPIRAERVRRQWYNLPYAWTGWRCSGVNGLFLDCVGKK